MFLNNLVDNCQAESRSFMLPALVFGREKRIENVFEVRLLDSLAVILNLDVNPDMSSRLYQLAGLNA